jgi:hypothetical protein
MASVDDVVTFTAHCCFGDICGKKWKRLGRYGTVEEARREIIRHLLASPKHNMSESEAKSHVQQYTKMGSEECCVMKTTEGSIPDASSGSNQRARLRARSRSGSREPLFNQQAAKNALGSALVQEPMRHDVLLPTYVEEDAVVIELSIQALGDIVDYFATHGGSTTLEEVPHLLKDFENIKVVLSSHGDQLRGVVSNMRNYKI